MPGTRILIVGGGIGGLATALALANHGVAARVVEQASQFGELGAGIQLAPNASWALDRLGVLEEVKALAVFPARIMWMDALSGEALTSLDLGDAFRVRYRYEYLVMHRSDLLNALLQACRRHPLVTLVTGKSFASLEHSDGGVRVFFADGTCEETEALVGADGLWSRVRGAVVGEAEPIGSAYVAYRGAIPIDDLSARAGLDTVMLWTGPDMHLVQYPVRRGELYNQVAVFKSDRYAAGAHDWGTPEELDERFSAAAPLVRTALTKIVRNRRWPMFDRLPVEDWTRGRTTLLGDAAHPMLQYLAQGACQALEDAVVLADAVAALPCDRVTEAFQNYQEARLERTSRVQTLARAWGEYWHLHPGSALERRNARLRGRAPDDYAEADWFYGYGTLAVPKLPSVASTSVPKGATRGLGS